MMPWHVHVIAFAVSMITHRCSLSVFCGEMRSLLRNQHWAIVWAKCMVVAAITCLVGLLEFPIGWVLANAASLVGMKIAFRLRPWLAFFIFGTNFVLFSIGMHLCAFAYRQIGS